MGWHTMRTMKYILQTILPLLIACLFISIPSNAQSAYHGGKGDGYASSEIQNIILSINPEISQTEAASIYPNPIKASQHLQIMMPKKGEYQIEIVNLLGQVVFCQAYNSEKANIPLSGYLSGSYIVNVRGGNFNYIQKLVIISS